MKRSLLGLIGLLSFVAFLPLMAGPEEPTYAAGDVIPGQYIVVLQPGADARAEAAAAARVHGAGVFHVYMSALNGFAFRGSAQAAEALARNPNVAYVSPDIAVEAIGKGAGRGGGKPPKDPKPTPTPTPTPAPPPAQEMPPGIARVGAAGKAASGIVAIAVIDTGIDPSHPDLWVKGGVGCIDGTSYVDGNSHGTHVAGTIAARNNSEGVVGVIPGAPLYAVKVLNSSGNGTWASVICGLDWVAANAANLGIKVANMSLSGGGSDSSCGTGTDALHDAVCGATNAGVTLVVAAANSGSDFAGKVPATYSEVLTVTAFADTDGLAGGYGSPETCGWNTPDDTPASFSNYAVSEEDRAHTVAAPGVCVKSTLLGGGYGTKSGTSMAAPHAAGVVALCIESGACAGSPAAVIAKVMSDADNTVIWSDPVARYYGNVVDAANY